MLSASTVTYILTNEPNNTFICTTTQEVGVFYGGISSTGLTAYPYKENRTDSKRCSNGKWVLFEDYYKPNEVIQPQTSDGTKYSCNQVECIKI